MKEEGYIFYRTYFRQWINLNQHLQWKSWVLMSMLFCMGLKMTAQNAVTFDPSVRYMYYNSLFPIYEYSGRSTLAVKKEKLSDIRFVDEISPELWSKLAINYNDRVELDHRAGINYPRGYNYNSPKANDYKQVIECVSVDILAISNGNVMHVKNTSDQLTAEQKKLLTMADLGTDISITIQFRYRTNGDKALKASTAKIITGHFTVTVVPETEAEYPGGFKKMAEYITENVTKKIPESASPEKMQQAIVTFVVNAAGKVMDAKISRTSGDLKADQLLLKAISKMPAWKPAENANGIKVKQEFSIPVFKSEGC